MPTMKKLTAEEIEAMQPKANGQRAEIAAEYDGYLAEFMPSDFGEVSLAEDENKTTVRNRLNAAAERRGWTLSYIRTKGPLMRFKIDINDQQIETGENVPTFGHDENSDTRHQEAVNGRSGEIIEVINDGLAEVGR